MRSTAAIFGAPVTEPPGNVNGYTKLEMTVRGVTEPNASVKVSNLPENPTVVADAEGRFEFLTKRPADGYADVMVFARGLLKHLVTRIYFEGEKANEIDPVLAKIEDAARRQTLIARRTPNGYRFDIRLQGEGETVFFDM